MYDYARQENDMRAKLDALKDGDEVARYRAIMHKAKGGDQARVAARMAD